MSRNPKYKIQKFGWSILMILILTGFVFPYLASANHCIPPFCFPFGGRIQAILPPVPPECWFPRIVVGPPRPITAAIVPGITKIYAWWAISIRHWVLGRAIPPIPGLCTSPIIEKIGTGAIPGD